MSLVTIACSSTQGDAQTARAQATTRAPASASRFSPEQHVLDAATVRKLVTIMRGWTPAPPPKPKGEDAKDVLKALDFGIRNTFTVVVARELAEQDSTATIDSSPALTGALAREGLSSREFARALLAFQAARFAEEMNKVAPHTPTLVVQRNIAIIRGVFPSEELPSWW